MSEMQLVGIRVEQPQQQPVMLLRESEGERFLPIWIGQAEATSIALEQQGIAPARPLTHDLVKDIVEALDRTLVEVRIVALREGTFYADLVFDEDISVSARPSDAIAIAIRVGAPIFADESVLEEAGLEMPAEPEDEVEKFKEFLDTISPEDFNPGDTAMPD